MAEAHAYPDPVTRRFLTLSTMAATIMSALDTTIANVALPHMQGSVSASQDEITWVLTSYIVMNAIFIPLCGWIANRFGRKRLMVVSVIGFTLASALCGLATNLGELVGFRMLQGIFGAALVPMSQAILLDINPPERHGPAMAIWSLGAIMAPIVGPVLGGWLTDNLSWRWVFYVNVPVGALTLFGLITYLTESETNPKEKLDFTGFLLLAMALAALQLMLDRGQQQGWFSSTEICVEAAAAGFAFYCFVVHTATARDPFIDFAIFRDRNFGFGIFMGFLFGVMLFSALALLPAMLQQLMGYPVILTGLASTPRGVGTMISTLFVSRLIQRFDPRYIMLAGFALTAVSIHYMASFSLGMDYTLVMWSGLLAGLGNGLIFVPLSTLSFSTLSARFRNEGTAMYTLIRSIGSAVGISVLQALITRNTSIVHSRLVEGIRPDNPVLDLRMPGFDFNAPGAVAQLNAEITRQASMVAYVDSYWAMFLMISCMGPIVLLMKPPRHLSGGKQHQIHVE